MIRNLLKKSSVSKEFDALIEQVEKIRSQHDVLNLCARPTGNSWLGVRNAGFSLFPECSAEIPQYYSNQVLSSVQLQELGDKIGSLGFEQLIFNGYNTYFLEIIKAARKIRPQLQTGVIHHGFFGELSGNPIMISIVSNLVQSYKEGYITKIGFLKKGNAEVMNVLYGINSFYIINKNPEITFVEKPLKRIGVMTNDAFRKNTATQIVGALCLKTYDVAVLSKNGLEFMDENKRLQELGHMEHALFLQELAKNYINSHVTFSEASGGQVFTESLAAGVPCLTSLTHGYLDDNRELYDALVVDRFDDAWAIAQRMEQAIADRDRLSKLALEHTADMNQKSAELLTAFLENRK